MGAWIETKDEIKALTNKFVAPHVGAWIETFGRQCLLYHPRSLPMWERGLKHLLLSSGKAAAKVAPHVGAWIETRSF